MSERRDFLKTAAAGMLIVTPATAFGSQANSTVEVGLVGCGGRGNWIGPFFPEYAGARIVALADVQKANLEATSKALKVDTSRTYWGPDAAEKLANSKLDGVVIETPTFFHAEQARLAVDAGKHVFMAKPLAVDVPATKSILMSGEEARRKHVSFYVDFQTRVREVYQEAARRIHRGDIGKPAMAEVLYYAGRPWKDLGARSSEPGQRTMLNWFGDRVLSGDIIVEQNIHVIDVANWFLQGNPLKAYGTGGRSDWRGTVNDTGDCWDHFLVTYYYPNNVQATFSSHQLNGAFSDLCVRVMGIDGTADTHYGGSLRIVGKNPWQGAEKDDTFKGGAVENVKRFVESIRTGKPIYNYEEGVRSNLTGILGRTAAYLNREVTWDEIVKSDEKWTIDLKLKW